MKTITEEISGINQSAVEIKNRSGLIVENSGQLSGLAEQLNMLVSRFKLA